MAEQRNPYKGIPPRCWVLVRFVAPDGTLREMQLLADTGNPYAVIIGKDSMRQLKHNDIPNTNTNFGLLEGGTIKVVMPELGLDLEVPGYASDAVVSVAQASSPDFEGLVGLPFLQLVQYSGDANDFWLRPLSNPP